MSLDEISRKIRQGSHGHGNLGKVMEIENVIFQAWKCPKFTKFQNLQNSMTFPKLSANL